MRMLDIDHDSMMPGFLTFRIAKKRKRNLEIVVGRVDRNDDEEAEHNTHQKQLDPKPAVHQQS